MILYCENGNVNTEKEYLQVKFGVGVQRLLNLWNSEDIIYNL